MARPFELGAIRYPGGKINRPATDKQDDKADEAPPSGKVKRHRDIFSALCFKGGGRGNHAGDAIGQLWLLGLLDTPDLDDTRLLDGARAWWHGRETTFKGLGHKTAKYERASRTSNQSTKLSKPEKDYARYNSFLLDASDYDSDCLIDLMETNIDGDIRTWVSRIIQTELLKHMRLPLAELACDDDYARLAAAKRALIAMAGFQARREDRAA